MRVKVSIAIGEAERSGGRVYALRARGAPRCAGGYTEIVHDGIAGRFRRTFSGKLRPGRTYLLHVEGDREFIAGHKTSVEEFARTNDGNFLLVTVTRR